MKSLFAAFVLSFVAFVAPVSAGEGPQSVLQQPTPAAAPADAAMVAVAAPCGDCANGVCCAESSSRSSCRAGLFGRTIERTRTVTRAVVEVPVKVVTAPVRVVRARRGCCCN